MLSRFLCIMLVSISCLLVGQELIPRGELFKEPYERSFYPSHSGKYVFWLEAGQSENNVVVHEINTGEKVKYSLEGKLFQIVPFTGNKALLIKAQESGPLTDLVFIDLTTGEIDSLKTSGRIRIRHFTKRGVILSEQASPQFNQEYTFLPFEGESKSLGSFDELDDLYFSNNLEVVSASRRNRDGSTEMLYKKDEEWKVLQTIPWNEGMFLGGLQKVVSVHADGSKIYYVSNHESDKNKLYEFNIATEKSSVLASSDNTDILPMGALLDEDYKPIYAVSIYAKSQYHIVQSWFEEHLNYIRSEVGKDVSVVDPMWNAGIILFRKFTGASNQYFVYNVNTRKVTPIHEENSWLSDYSFARRSAHDFKTSDGLKLPFHIYLPNGSDLNQDGLPDQPLPTIMYVHGGPWVGLIHFNSWFHLRNYQLLANRGYVVVVGEFRGTTGLGKEVIHSSYKEWGGKMARDKKELADWLISHKVSPKDSICIWGWSYGGYAAMQGLAKFPDLYACGISMYGLPSIVPQEGGLGYGDPFWEKQLGDPKSSRDVEMLKETSPINQVEKIKKPLLMTTGSRDQKVSKVQNDEMADKLYEEGKEVTYLFYPDEVHDYRAPESWVSFWAYGEEFLSEHLGGKIEDPTEDKTMGNYKLVYKKGIKIN